MSRILITGAAGAVGQTLLHELADSAHDIIATDIRPPTDLPARAQFQVVDVCGPDAARVISEVNPDVVIHLASIVTPPKGLSRDSQFAVDVTGSKNVLAACIAAGVKRLVVTSSGAAYGYHADNPVPLCETDPLRGNSAFAYADHKRQVEEILAQARKSDPQLEQVIFRVGTVLGEGLENQITALFRKPRLLAIRGANSPFVFIWTNDLARILRRAAEDGPVGIFNVAGDGSLSVPEIAARLGKPVMTLPGWLLRAALRIAKPLGLSRYGPEQVVFLEHRPVLDNSALKDSFGYTPKLTSAETFELWKKAADL